MKVITAATLAAMFVAPIPAQITLPDLPDSAIEHGIMNHPDVTSPNHCYETYCCSRRDCRPLAAGSVKITPVGYSIPLPDGSRELVKFSDSRVRKTPPKCLGEDFGQSAHACYHKVAGKWAVRCVYPRVGLF